MHKFHQSGRDISANQSAAIKTGLTTNQLGNLVLKIEFAFMWGDHELLQ